MTHASARKTRNIYDIDLDKNAANYCALTPLGFLERSADVYPDRPAVIHGEKHYTWRETHARCRRLAHALTRRGIGPGDTVSIMSPSIPAHFFEGKSQGGMNSDPIVIVAAARLFPGSDSLPGVRYSLPGPGRSRE